MTHDISGLNRLVAGAFVLAVSAAIVAPTHAVAKFKAAPNEEVAPETTGPAWIHLTLRTGNVRSDSELAGPMVGVAILAERTQ